MNLITLVALAAAVTTAALAALKIVHVIAWSWWWVTSPAWGFVILSLVGAMALAAWLAIEHEEGRNPFE